MKKYIASINKEDRIITKMFDKILSFNGNIRYYLAQQHKYFYAKKSWLNPSKSQFSTDQVFFQYSLN